MLQNAPVIISSHFDMDKKDLVCIVQDESGLEKTFDDLNEIMKIVDETTTTMFAPNRYVKLKKDENGIHLIE